MAGVCALILSANPSLTANEVKRILIHTADKVGHLTEYSDIGHSVRYGFGRVNALKAVKMAKSGLAIPPIPTKPNENQIDEGLNDILNIFKCINNRLKFQIEYTVN